jgi:hypothetical protein
VAARAGWRAPPGRFTPRIEPSAVDDLLERAPRAALAFVDGRTAAPP